MRKNVAVLLGLVAISLCLCLELSATDIDIYVVPAITDEKILPDTPLTNSLLSKAINLIVCKGEYEPASFVVKASGNVSNFAVTATNLQLQGATGTIPAANVDLKVVKCWYQSGYTIVDTTHKHLTPELLLYDDFLVNVSGSENYLKLSPEGDDPYYTCISTPASGSGMQVLSFEGFSVVDAPCLQALELVSGENKQFWVTVKVPENATAGTYVGNINLNATGVSESIILTVNVPAITLAESFLTYSIYYRGLLRNTGSISSEDKNETQFAAEIQNLVAHGVTSPVIYKQEEYPATTILGDVLTILNDKAADIDNLYYLGLRFNATANLATLQANVAGLKSFISSYGVDELYVYGPDETYLNTEAIRARIGAVHNGGGKTFASQSYEYAEDIVDVLDLANVSLELDSDLADLYHDNGHKIFSYANPQVGEETPVVYRRNFGLWLWLNGYDGVMDYAYQHSFENIWNDFDHYYFRDLTFVYPTMNGVIDTIAWEGFREGVDDTRYLTTLLEKIDAVMTGNNDDLKAIAGNAQNWLNTIQLDGDLNEIRAKILQYILRLNELPDGTLLGQWTFDDGTGSTSVTDSSNNNHNGTLVNLDKDTAWVDGKVGKALEFDGTGYVNFGTAASLDTVNYTVVGWVKVTNDNVIRRIISMKYGSNNGFFLQIAANDDIYAYQSVNGSTFEVMCYTPYPDDGEYHHVAMSFNYNGITSTLKLYVDGVLGYSKSAIGAPDAPSASANLLLGFGGTFVGEMDEFKFYNKVLGDNEIKAICNSANLRASWSFNESSGSTCTNDTSGWENFGTLVNLDENTAWVDGRAGNALEFDGVGYVNCGSNDSFNLDNYTITGWIKPMTSAVASRHIIERRDGGGGFLLQLWSENSLCAYQYVNGSLYGVSTSASFPHDSKYHHFAMVFSYDGTDSTLKLYIDGELEVSRTETKTPDFPAASTDLLIGEGDFEGMLDEFKIYSKALEANEIKAIYNDTDLRAAWSFSESSGSTYTTDISGQGNRGILVNLDEDTAWGIGKAGNALEFDGVGYVNCGSNDSLNVNDYTIMGWIKPTTSAVASRQIIERRGGTGGFLLQLWDNNYLYAYQWVNGSLSGITVSTPFPHDNTYHHFAMVFSYNGTDSNSKLYVDGVLKTSRTETGAPDPPAVSDELLLGEGNFEGMLDEFKIYGRAFSDAEITATYNSY